MREVTNSKFAWQKMVACKPHFSPYHHCQYDTCTAASPRSGAGVRQEWLMSYRRVIYRCKVSGWKFLFQRAKPKLLTSGKEFANRLERGSLIALYGDLGAGKTRFVKGVCEGCSVKEVVNSPTFTLVNEYHGTLPSSGTTHGGCCSVPH